MLQSVRQLQAILDIYMVNHELQQLTKYLSTINSAECDPYLTPNLFISPEYHF